MVRLAHTLEYRIYLQNAIGQHIPGHPLLLRMSQRLCVPSLCGLITPRALSRPCLAVQVTPSEGTCRQGYGAVVRGFRA
jgi:hypothetical protein